MTSRHHIHDFMRGRIIGKIEEGQKITDVAREFDITQSVVSRLWKSFKTTGMCSRRHGEVVLEVRRLQKTDISSYQQKEQAHHSSAGNKSVSCCLRKADLPKKKTVARRLRGGGIYARRPVVCVPLTRQHRTARLQWCHLNPIENVWDALGRQVACRNYPPTNKNILIRALTEEWDKLPQQLLDNVVQSIVRRVECCVTLHGGHIPY
ncbi:transposable element Tcb1 transposase [Trichonephila clavipes]|nr:transposable element Tcb1 transposase [Trichonephila clavipes]